MRTPLNLFVIMLMLAATPCKSQGTDSLADNIANLPSRFFSKIQKKYASIESNLSKKSNRYLTRLQKQEKKLRKQLYQRDSTQKENTDSVYKAFRQQLSEQQQRIKDGKEKVNLTEYNSYIDTLSTSLEFLKGTEGLADQIKLPADALNGLKSKLNESGKIKEFIAQRKEQLKSMLSGYTKLPASLQREYTKLNQTIYYYHAQVQEYRDMLKDPEKMERKALSLISKIPAFQKFMRENSQLASLFGMPENYGTPASLAGLQTRASVQQIIQQRIQAGGPNATAMVQQNLQEAQTKLNELKDKLKNALPGSNGADADLADLPTGQAGFKPNTQKTKSFLKRVEYGFNVQFSKNNNWLPTTSDLGLSIGYKLNDRSTAGIGLSYRVGLGNINHIAITSQGVGLRSYLDWKIKGSLFASGGYEMNYNSAFKSIQQLKGEVWQRSGLIGVSKSISLHTKYIRGNKIQLLWDFLSYSQVPRPQPIIFRTCFSLNK